MPEGMAYIAPAGTPAEEMNEAIRQLAEAAKAAGQSIQDFVVTIRCAGDCKDFKKNGVTWSEWRDGRVLVHTCEKELDPNG